MRTKLVFRYLFMVLAVAIMVCIFLMSAQSATVSSQSSGRVIRAITKIFVEDFESRPIDYQLIFISSLQLFIRKAAHFVLYFSLGFSVCGCALTFAAKTKLHKSVISFVISVLYAVSDEIHQLFVSGRSGQISDIVLDAFGIIFGILFVNLLFSITLRIYLRCRGRRIVDEQ